jgi:cytochrome P450
MNAPVKIRTEVPGPKPRFLQSVRNVMAMRRDILGFWQKLKDDYGDVAQFKLGKQQLYLFSRPDMIQDVLVTNAKIFHKSRGLEMTKKVLGEGLLTSEGDYHKRQRRMVQPAFHAERVNAYGPEMVDYAARASQRWTDGAQVDCMEEMMRIAVAIAGKTLFNADVEGSAAEIFESLSVVISMFTRLTNPLAPLLDKLPLPSNMRFVKAKKKLDALIYKMIEQRRSEGKDCGDFLSMLLKGQDGENLSDLQVRDEAITIFLAGHETTAVTLTWTWYLLSQNPDAEAKLHAELKSVLNGRAPTVADLPRLPYTRMVLAEAMRVYPPAYALGRKAMQDYDAGPYRIPKGATIFMSQFVVHRDPQFFPDPLKFIPERWTPQEVEKRPRFSYFPFGGGPRVCIGEAFAWMEASLLLATLAQNWTMRHVEGHRIVLQPLITLRPKFGMKMILKKRL